MRCNRILQFCIYLLMFSSVKINAQYMMQNTFVIDCEGTLSDSDMGPEDGQYDHNEDYTFTICVQGASTITAIFEFFATEFTYDILTIYDGPDTNSPIIAELDGVLTNPPIIVANSGCMTLHFVSDDNIVALGWLMSWEVEIDDILDPELNITSPLDCPLGSLDFTIDPRIPCDILVPENFQLLGPDPSGISSVTPLDCDGENTVSNFTINFSDSLSLAGSYNLIFNGYIVNSCGDTLTFESLIGFELSDCPFEVEIFLAEQACPGECGRVEVVIYSTDPGPFAISWAHTTDNSEIVDICVDTATLVNVLVENVSTGTTGTDEFWYVPYQLPMILNPLMSDTFCSSRGNHTFNIDNPGGLWNSGIMDNTDDSRYRFRRWSNQNGVQEDVIIYTDENGCSTNDTVYIIPINAGLDQSVCVNQPTLQLTGNNPNDGIWEGPNTTPEGLFTTTVADTFFISYTNDEGCSDEKRVFVIDQIELTQLDTLCSNVRIELYEYVNSLGGTWTGPGINNWYTGSLQAWKANINEWNTYVYEVEGCRDSMEIYIQGIWAGPDRTLCSSIDNIQMYFEGSWTGPGIYNPIDSSYDISMVTPGTYDIYGAKAGCEDRFELSIVDVNLEFNGQNQYCHDAGMIPINDVVQSTPNDGIFSGEGIIDIQGDIYFDPSLVSGTESFIVFESLNCTDSVFIKVEQALQLGDYEFCEFSSLQNLDNMGFEGYWEGPGILIPESGLINIAELNPGLHEVFFISEKGCGTSVTVNVIQFEEAEILGILENYCFQDTNYSLGLYPLNGTLTINGIEVSPQINPSVLGTGYHEIEYTVGVDECEDKLSLYIVIDEPISGFTYANFDTLCPDESTSIFVETSGGNGSITAIWDQGLGFGKSHIISPNQNTSYSVILSDGCSDDVTLDLDIHVIDTFSVGINYGPEVCYGDSSYIELFLNKPDDFSITWDGISSPNGHYFERVPGTYHVNILNNLSGCEQEYELIIPGADPLGANFILIPNQDCIDLINNELNIVDLAFGYTDGILNFGETDEQLDLLNDELQYTYYNIGEFDITQVVFNELGCSDTLVQTICVENVVRFFKPNIFSPNNDGVNDLFSMFSLGISDFSMQIYDGWGNLVFATNDPNESWDGKHDGKEVNQGVYVGMVKYQDQETGKPYTEFFDLTVVR